MEKFVIAIKWEGYADIVVEAESLEEAVNKVELDSDELVLPKDWDLVEGSIDVNHQMTENLNPGHKIKDEPVRKELEAKDFGIVDKEKVKVGECLTQEEEEAWRGIDEYLGDDEEREARRNLAQLGEGYEEDTEEEGDEEEG